MDQARRRVLDVAPEGGAAGMEPGLHPDPGPGRPRRAGHDEDDEDGTHMMSAAGGMRGGASAGAPRPYEGPATCLSVLLLLVGTVLLVRGWSAALRGTSPTGRLVHHMAPLEGMVQEDLHVTQVAPPDVVGNASARVLDEPEPVMLAVTELARSVLFPDDYPVFGASHARVLDTIPGLRTFVCIYYEQPTSFMGSKHTHRSCGTGIGRTLKIAAYSAAYDLVQTIPDPNVLSLQPRAGMMPVRLKFDIAVGDVKRHDPCVRKDPVTSIRSADVGLLLFYAEAGDASSFLLPSEIIEQGINKERGGALSSAKMLSALKSRSANPRALISGKLVCGVSRTLSWVERDAQALSADDKATSVSWPPTARTYRIHLEQPDPVEPDVLLQRSLWAGSYLISSVSPEGRIRYQYDVNSDSIRSGYNILRHAGTTYSMIQLYDRTRYRPFLDAAKAAIGYLLAHSRSDVRSGPYMVDGDCLYPFEDGKIKLGGAGLALLALTTYTETTGDNMYSAQMEQLATFITASQQHTGEFWYFPSVDASKTPTSNKPSAYYPGEAILGLMKLHSLTHDKRWLDTAQRAAKWLILTRDLGKTENNIDNDHWLLIALSYLFKFTKDDMYWKHTLLICRAIRHSQGVDNKRAADYPDYRGGYFDPPGSTAAATRSEGLVAALDTCEIAGKTESDCGFIMDLLLTNLGHQFLQQYIPDTMWWVPNRSWSFGAIAGGLADPSIRNDFVQHSLSSFLGAERQLRKAAPATDPAIQLPGGPLWSQDKARGFAGLPPQQTADLMRMSAAYRGETQWERKARQA